MAGARMTPYYPVSIPGHGMALNITVQSYAGSLEFGLTACRRVLSQEESYELVGHLRDALEEIRRLPSVEQGTEPAADSQALPAPPAPAKATKKRTPKVLAKPPGGKSLGDAKAAGRRMQ